MENLFMKIKSCTRTRTFFALIICFCLSHVLLVSAHETEEEHVYHEVIQKATLKKNGHIQQICECGDTLTTPIYKASKISIKTAKLYYTGESRTPRIIVQDSQGETIDSSHYKVVVSPKKKVGTYTAKVTFESEWYEGEKELTWSIVPKKAYFTSIKAHDNQLDLKWKKMEGAGAYQIQYCTSKYFKKNVTTVTVSAKYTSKTIKKVDSDKKYYLRIRAYRNDTYGEWSKVKESIGPRVSLKTQKGVYYLSWTKDKYAYGYEIRIASKKSGTYKALTRVKNNRYKSYNLIKQGKKYYKVVPYYYENKKRIYTKASGAQLVDITRVKLSVEYICQYPSLPTGCESTALTMVLNYHGYNVSKETIARDYLPKTSIPGDFYNYFLGNPFSKSGLGIYAPGLNKTANKYLKAKKSDLKSYDITGASIEKMCSYVAKGYPICIWTTYNLYSPPRVNSSWVINGKTYVWKSNQHCMTLIGYDEKKDTLIIANPAEGIKEYDRDLIELRNKQYNRMATVIK